MNLLTPASRRGYRRRILLDLTVLLLALGVLWAGMGFPLPQSLRFHAMERRRLLESSQVVLETKLTSGRHVTVGITDDHIHAAATTWDPALDQFYRWERSGKPQLILLPNDYADAPVFAAVDAPSEAVAAELSITLSLQGPADISAEYTAAGKLDGGLFLFTLEPQYNGEHSTLAQAESLWLRHGYHSPQYRQLPPYTLTFFDGSGAVLTVVHSENTP